LAADFPKPTALRSKAPAGGKQAGHARYPFNAFAASAGNQQPICSKLRFSVHLQTLLLQ
jgi:hypothetical protein